MLVSWTCYRKINARFMALNDNCSWVQETGKMCWSSTIFISKISRTDGFRKLWSVNSYCVYIRCNLLFFSKIKIGHFKLILHFCLMFRIISFCGTSSRIKTRLTFKLKFDCNFISSSQSEPHEMCMCMYPQCIRNV